MMTDLKEKFEDAAARSKSLPNQSNEVLLELYALYKQATKGDVSGSQPGMFDMVGRAKYDAWSKLKGTSTDDAMTSYISRINELEAE
jgi:acyl-CoA-binding protein